MSSYSPDRSLNQTYNTSGVLEKSLILNKKRSKLKESFFWLGVNSTLLAVIVYDLSQTCPMYMNYYHYVEYSLIIIFTLNVLFYFGRIVKLYFTSSEQIAVTLEQKKLLGVKDSDPNYTLISPSKTPGNMSSSSSLQPNTPMNMTALSWRSNPSPGQQTTPLNMSALSWRSNPSPGQQTTPLNMTALSWRSNRSQTDSRGMNYSMQSPSSWNFQKGVSNTSPVNSFGKSPLSTYHQGFSNLQYIEDEEGSGHFLNDDDDDVEKVDNLSREPQNATNLLSSFWSHPVTKSAKDMSVFLKTNQYQLSSQLPNKSLSGSPSSKQEDKSGVNVPTLEVWTRINVDTVALTQWNENLRMWISQTILERLVKEFDSINDSLDKHSMADIKIGAVGLDRLRKTALMNQITHFIPSLSTIIPFLEQHANQEYLVKRIRELSRGGCMSEFKWNGGGHYKGKEWDDTLPTDCAIVMHLLASYLDTQLMPSPNMPDTKAFSGHYYVRATDKMPSLTPSSLFIQEATEKPPHYRVVVGEQSYEMVKGYNNLFHSILFFIYHVNKLEQSMLGRVNLGRAGLNMLWVIGLNE